LQAKEVIDKCFRGTASRIGGVGFDVLAHEALERHALAFEERHCDSQILRDPGFLHWRSGGENHVNDPSSIAYLQEATMHENKAAYKKFEEAAMQSARDCTIRGQLEIAYDQGKPIPVEEVESTAEIVKRFATGAMSFGSISYEAHSTLAVAMNRLGGKSNTGEGGENAERYADGQDPMFNMRSAIKQGVYYKHHVLDECFYIVETATININITIFAL
jgi:glutamate synthase (NADPH/NADH)